MRIVAIAGQKGGTGKTLLATSLAVLAQEAGRTAAILDLDPQGSAAEWGDLRGAAPGVKPAQAPRLARLVEQAREEGVEDLFIDCPPNADAASLAACRAADLVLVPCRPAARDLSAVAATVRLALEVAQKPAAVVLNGCPPGSGITEEAAKAVTEEGVTLCPVRIGQRVAHVKFQPAGRTASEVEPRGPAADELRALAAWVDEALGMRGDKAPSRPGVKSPRRQSSKAREAVQ